MGYRRLLFLLLFVLAGTLALPAAVGAAPGGNAAAAHACQAGGYANYTRADGSTFPNTGACVSYVAQGETLHPRLRIISVSYDAALNRVHADFAGTGFAANSPLVDFILEVPVRNLYIDFIDIPFPPPTTDASGNIDGYVETLCVGGAQVFVTITDSEGNSATTSFTMTCS